MKDSESNTVPITVHLIKKKKQKLESKCRMLANSYIKKISNESRILFLQIFYIWNVSKNLIYKVLLDYLKEPARSKYFSKYNVLFFLKTSSGSYEKISSFFFLSQFKKITYMHTQKISHHLRIWKRNNFLAFKLHSRFLQHYSCEISFFMTFKCLWKRM